MQKWQTWKPEIPKKMQTEKMVQPWKDIKEIVALSSDPNKWRKAQLDMKHSPTVHWHFSFLATILRYPYEDQQSGVYLACAIYSLLFLGLAPKNPKTHLSGYEFAKKCVLYRWFGHFNWEVSLFLARWHHNQCVQQVMCCAIYHGVLVIFQAYCYMPSRWLKDH